MWISALVAPFVAENICSIIHTDVVLLMRSPLVENIDLNIRIPRVTRMGSNSLDHSQMPWIPPKETLVMLPWLLDL